MIMSAANAAMRRVYLLAGALFLASLCAASARTVGPDADGYTGTDETLYNWDEIATELGGSGTEITALTGTDDDYEQIPIGFTFKFYGVKHTSVFVSVNGLLAFDQAGLSNAYDNARIPNVDPPDNFIAPFWDDLCLMPTQKIYYAVLGTEPYRRLVIEYFGTAHFDDPNARYFFEVILYETWNEVRCQYRSMNNGPGFFFGDGRSATVGIEGPGGSSGMEWFYHEIRSVTNRLSVLFFPEVESDLELTKTGAPDPSYVNGDIVYTLTVSNVGPDTATEVTLVDYLPSSVLLTGITNSQGASAYGGNVVTSYVGTVEDGTTAVINIYVRPQTGGVITNVATVSAAQTDPDPTGNTVTQSMKAAAHGTSASGGRATLRHRCKATTPPSSPSPARLPSSGTGCLSTTCPSPPSAAARSGAPPRGGKMRRSSTISSRTPPAATISATGSPTAMTRAPPCR